MAASRRSRSGFGRTAADRGSTPRSTTRAPATASPLLMVRYRPLGTPLQRVYDDPAVDILALPDAAPYAQDDLGRCRLVVEDRTAMTADCSGPARLLRRELMDPGWRATVDGHPVAVSPSGELFQSVALPAGRSVIRFSYAPPLTAMSAVMMVAGLCWMAAGATRRRRTP